MTAAYSPSYYPDVNQAVSDQNAHVVSVVLNGIRKELAGWLSSPNNTIEISADEIPGVLAVIVRANFDEIKADGPDGRQISISYTLETTVGIATEAVRR